MAISFKDALERKTLDYQALAEFYNDQREPSTALAFTAAALALAGLAAAITESQEGE